MDSKKKELQKITSATKDLLGLKVVEGIKKIPWTIIDLREGELGVEYQIEFAGLTKKWIKGNDPNWSIFEEDSESITQEEREIAKLIDDRIIDNVSGSLEGFESNLIEMADIHVSKSGAWTGGASDCVAVGGFSEEKVMLVHADRTSTLLAKRIINKAPIIYLASEVFFKGGEKAVKNGNVIEIIKMIIEAKKEFNVFKSKQLAISFEGEVFTDFVPKRKKRFINS